MHNSRSCTTSILKLYEDKTYNSFYIYSRWGYGYFEDYTKEGSSGTWKLERSELILSDPQDDFVPVYIFTPGKYLPKLVPKVEGSMTVEEAEENTMTRSDNLDEI